MITLLYFYFGVSRDGLVPDTDPIPVNPGGSISVPRGVNPRAAILIRTGPAPRRATRRILETVNDS